MQLVLEIKNEKDLAILLPLMERLKIPFTLPKSASTKKSANDKAKPGTPADPTHPVSRFIGCLPPAEGDALAEIIDREFSQIEGEW